MTTRKYDDLTVGTRFFYTGDMANQSGFGVVSAVRAPTRFAPLSYDLAYDDGRAPSLGIWHTMFAPSIGRRFILESEWRAEREAKIAAFTAGQPKAEDFPATIDHEGRTYRRTGKLGKRIATGEPSAEYSAKEPGVEYRAWRTLSGDVQSD